jgi:hypothetical protein
MIASEIAVDRNRPDSQVRTVWAITNGGRFSAIPDPR